MRLALVGLVGLLAVAAAAAHGSMAKPPRSVAVSVHGPTTTVFSWSKERCDDADIPDLPARAFRDVHGQVDLIATHYLDRRFGGRDFSHLRHPYGLIMRSNENPDPAAFDDKGWISATWTADGRRVYALVHDEYQGDAHGCGGGYLPCWYNAITLAVSTNGGATYLAPRRRLIASIPFPFSPGGGPAGIFEPTNIVRNSRDGYLYAIVHQEIQGSNAASCLIRTRTPGIASSWRAWSGGTSFTTTFVNPYAGPVADPAAHLCRDVGPAPGFNGSSLSYNTVARQWLRVLASGDGFYYSLSPDLIRWTLPVQFFNRPWMGAWQCGQQDPVAYPSLIDPASSSRNFDTSGAKAYLYYTQFNIEGCQETLNRDLLRVGVAIAPR